MKSIFCSLLCFYGLGLASADIYLKNITSVFNNPLVDIHWMEYAKDSVFISGAVSTSLLGFPYDETNQADYFVARIDLEGNVMWYDTQGYVRAQIIHKILVDPITGYLYGFGETGFDYSDPSAGTANYSIGGMQSQSNLDCLLVKYSLDGDLIFAEISSNSGPLDDVCWDGLILDSDSEIMYVTGRFDSEGQIVTYRNSDASFLNNIWSYATYHLKTICQGPTWNTIQVYGLEYPIDRPPQLCVAQVDFVHMESTVYGIDPNNGTETARSGFYDNSTGTNFIGDSGSNYVYESMDTFASNGGIGASSIIFPYSATEIVALKSIYGLPGFCSLETLSKSDLSVDASVPIGPGYCPFAAQISPTQYLIYNQDYSQFIFLDTNYTDVFIVTSSEAAVVTSITTDAITKKLTDSLYTISSLPIFEEMYETTNQIVRTQSPKNEYELQFSIYSSVTTSLSLKADDSVNLDNTANLQRLVLILSAVIILLICSLLLMCYIGRHSCFKAVGVGISRRRTFEEHLQNFSSSSKKNAGSAKKLNDSNYSPTPIATTDTEKGYLHDFSTYESITTTRTNIKRMETINYGSTTWYGTEHVLSLPGYLAFESGKDFTVLECLAKGGSGMVYRAFTMTPPLKKYGNDIVVKALSNPFPSEKESIAFNQEVSIMNFFKDVSTIAKILGYSETPKALLMKYYKFGSLEKFIQAPATKPINLQMKFLHDIASGIRALHMAGIVHCDIKPANILLDVDEVSKQPRCVITDFGISLVIDESLLAVRDFKVSKLFGASLIYAAPEVLMLKRKDSSIAITPNIIMKRDIYALGIIFCQIMSGYNLTW